MPGESQASCSNSVDVSAENRADRDALAVQAFVNDYENTMGAAPQSSAVRMIRLLRHRYPAAAIVTPEGQSSLAGYIGRLIKSLNDPAKPLPELTREERDNPGIGATIRMTEWILRHGDSLDIKTDVLTQLQSIAKTCPGLQWDNNHKQWSTNKFYNAQTGKDELVMASTAETLNLICAAIFDPSRWVGFSMDQAELEVDLRARALMKIVLELAREAKVNQLERCSRGRNNEMLFVLNGVFLDEQNKPVELIENTPLFLLQSSSRFIVSVTANLTEEKQSRLTNAWLAWETTSELTAESPLVIFLREKYPASADANKDEAWQEACVEFLKKSAEAFGLNPADCDLQGTAVGLAGLGLRSHIDPLILIKRELLLAKDQAMQPWNLAFNALIGKRNTALFVMKEKIRGAGTIDGKQIQSFYTAEHFFQQLLRYASMMTLGSIDGEFLDARKALQATLEDYYDHYPVRTTLPASFKPLKKAFLMQEKIFKAQSHQDFVENFFKAMGTGPTIQAHAFLSRWHRLQALNPVAAGLHPLLLKDEDLLRWYEENCQEEGTESRLCLSSFEVNRILIHAVLVEPAAWSETFLQALLWLCPQLLKANLQDSLSLRALKADYPTSFLCNLLLVAHLQHNPQTRPSVKEQIERLSRDKTDLVAKRYFLRELMENSNDTDRDDILEATKDFLPLLSPGIHYIHALIELPNTSLSAEQLERILLAHEGNWPRLTETAASLELFLYIREAQLPVPQRTQIIREFEGHWSALIKDLYDLNQLLGLAGRKIPTEIATKIPQELDGRWASLINNGYELGCFFDQHLDLLSPTQRVQILKELEGNWRRMIRNGSDAGYLLKLRETELPKQILAELQGHWVHVFKDAEELASFLALSEAQLPLILRLQILQELEGHWAQIIKNGKEAARILSLSKAQLPKAHHRQILQELKGHWPEIIKNTEEAAKILSLPKTQLPGEYPAQILQELRGNWVQLFEGPQGYETIFSLSETQLPFADRTQIMQELEGHWSSVIRSVYILDPLIRLPETQFPRKYLGKILQELKGHWSRLIDDNLSAYTAFRWLALMLPFNSALLLQLKTELKGHWCRIYPFTRYKLPGVFRLSQSMLTLPERMDILRELMNGWPHTPGISAAHLAHNRQELADFIRTDQSLGLNYLQRRQMQRELDIAWPWPPESVPAIASSNTTHMSFFQPGPASSSEDFAPGKAQTFEDTP